jgi:hypothetical protein
MPAPVSVSERTENIAAAKTRRFARNSSRMAIHLHKIKSYEKNDHTLMNGNFSKISNREYLQI